MSIKFDHTNHKKLWNWLAENPDKEKTDWPEWEKNGGRVKRVRSNCFACEYAEGRTCEDERVDLCEDCPLVWHLKGVDKPRCNLSSGLWSAWFWENTLKKRGEYALQIANLPVKDGVETI